MLATNVNSFFDTGLLPGTTYTYTIQSANNAGPSALAKFTIATPASDPAGFSAHVNFSSSTGPVPAGYVNDTGAAYGSQANGMTYGWLINGQPGNNSANAFVRGAANSPDLLHDSFIAQRLPNGTGANWRIAVPNGTYLVHILEGDPGDFNSYYGLAVNGVIVTQAVPNALNLWADGTRLVTITNGLLTVTAGGLANNNKYDAIDILPAPPAAQAQAINAGGPSVGSFTADAQVTGGLGLSIPGPIDISGVTNPAPLLAYQSIHYGSAFTYTLANLTPGGSYEVRLHFAELTLNGPGLRTFDVAINGNTVLTNFDVFQAAGGFKKAVIESFTTTADINGKIAIAFTGVKLTAIVNAIEVLSQGP